MVLHLRVIWHNWSCPFHWHPFSVFRSWIDVCDWLFPFFQPLSDNVAWICYFIVIVIFLCWFILDFKYEVKTKFSWRLMWSADYWFSYIFFSGGFSFKTSLGLLYCLKRMLCRLIIPAIPLRFLCISNSVLINTLLLWMWGCPTETNLHLPLQVPQKDQLFRQKK